MTPARTTTLAWALVFLWSLLGSGTASADESHCPLGCTCSAWPPRTHSSKMLANCSGLSLTVLPAHFQHHIAYLDASFNNIETISKEFFGEVKLKLSKINLSNNSISTIDKRAFALLPELWIMNLTGNKIKNLNHDTFKFNSNLSYLILRGNNINIDSHAIFLNAPQIRKLDLSYNNLRELRETTFSQMNNIVYLRLHNNQFKKLSSSWFQPLGKLERLYVEHNQLMHLDIDTFIHTPKLMELSLSWNKLIVPSNTPFLRLPNLELLYLTGCDFGNLPTHMFELSPRVRMLWIGSNRLRSLPMDVFNYLESLIFLNACDNQLNCTCELKEAWNVCRYRNIRAHVNCAYPGEKMEALAAAGAAGDGCSGRWDVLEELACEATTPPAASPSAGAESVTSVARLAGYVALGSLLLLCAAAAAVFVYWKYRSRSGAGGILGTRNFAYADMMPLNTDREDAA